MSIDIFSLKAIENISGALIEWKKRLSYGLSQVSEEFDPEIPAGVNFGILFAGYVAQQYIQKTMITGDKRAVVAYDKIMKRIPHTIRTYFVDQLQPSETKIRYEIGSIPNLHSLVPMSQTAHKPIFSLKARDGVRGAHFNKVRDAEDIFRTVANQLLVNLRGLSS
jgi:hypothetical protein